MDTNTFHPNVSGSNEAQSDLVSAKLHKAAQMILVLAAGLSPILFIPTSFVSLGYGKLLLIFSALVIAVVFFSLAVLRAGSYSVKMPFFLLAIWLVVIASGLSAVFSGDTFDTVWGDGLGVHTLAFTAFLALTITTLSVLNNSKVAVTRLYALLVLSAIVLAAFHLSRLIFGSDFLAFGLFTEPTATLLGSWNGLAIFYGLVVLLSLVAIEQLPLTKIGRLSLTTAILLSLLMLVVVNFSPVFVVLAVVSAALLVYGLVKARWLGHQLQLDSQEVDTFWSSALNVAVLLFSLVLLVGGQQLGSFVADKTGINFVEVRPSLEATIDVGSAIYEDNLFFGNGPNKFVDAWRLHKSPEINQTIFWNTGFESGYSYLLTSAITGGLFVAIAWALFIVGLIYSGWRLFFRTEVSDKFWYFVGLSSFISSVYFWGISLVYSPSTSVMLLAGVCTGVFLAAYLRAVPGKTIDISITRHKNFGFVLIVIVMFALAATGGSLYLVSKHFTGTYQFNQSISTIEPGDSLEGLEAEILNAYQTVQNDAFLRQLTFYQLLQLQSLQNVSSPTEVERQAFERAAAQGVASGQAAVEADNTDPQSWILLGRVYSVLSAVGVSEAGDRARDAFMNARNYEPLNPAIPLLEAQLASQSGDLAEARRLAEESVRLRNFNTDALFFLTQIDITEGKVDQAISRTVDIISLEPQNPARYYQLGLLLAEQNRIAEATLAFEQAVGLDSQYANARYFLALSYLEQGETVGALEQLRVVSELNPDNEEIKQIISNLENGEDLETGLGASEPVVDSIGDGVSPSTVSNDDLESDLVTSSNPAPGEQSSVSEEAEGAESGS